MAASGDIEQAIEERLRAIDAELAGYDELVRERERLKRALEQLRSDSAAPAARATRRPATRPRRPRPSSGRRARRGSNIEAIVAYVTAHPGSTAADIASGTGIDRSIIYSATSRLAGSGRLRRVSKGDRQVGYELAAA